MRTCLHMNNITIYLLTHILAIAGFYNIENTLSYTNENNVEQTSHKIYF